MRWTGSGRESGNISDRRGLGPGAVIGGGGIGTVVIALIAYFVFGVDPSTVMNAAGGSPSAQGVDGVPHDEEGRFMARVLGSTEQVWASHFARSGGTYEPPTLVLYEQGTPTAGCGYGQAAAGPFYCPADRTIYVDLSFYRELDRRFGAPGDFAQAYVLAHEVGHHVQTLTGTSDEVRRAQQAAGSERGANALSVRLELQADCYAGVWASAQAQGGPNAAFALEPGDVEEGLRAAAAVGDDALTQGRVSPDAFTHGTSEERTAWFRRGLESGDPAACDTFAKG